MNTKNELKEYDGAYTGRKIKRIRKQLDMTAEELSYEVGCSKTHLYNIEAGTAKPSLEVAMNIARVLGISVDELLFPDASRIGKDRINDLPELRYRIMTLMDLYEQNDK